MQNAKTLSTHHGQHLKNFSLQTKSPQLSNSSTGVRERVSGYLPLNLAALALVVQWPTKIGRASCRERVCAIV